jgi:predicted TIM-barrel fold metal-dependent hydrolase
LPRQSSLKASVVVPDEDSEASAAEIRRRAGDTSFAQVMMLSRTSQALGRKRYWPIYQPKQQPTKRLNYDVPHQ